MRNDCPACAAASQLFYAAPLDVSRIAGLMQVKSGDKRGPACMRVPVAKTELREFSIRGCGGAPLRCHSERGAPRRKSPLGKTCFAARRTDPKQGPVEPGPLAS